MATTGSVFFYSLHTVELWQRCSSLPIVPKVYLLAAVLAIIANTCFGASFVLLNSFLPLLVRHHPRTQFQTPEATPELPSTVISEDPPEDSLSTPAPEPDVTTALLPPAPDNTPIFSPAKNITSIELRLSTQISSTGIGIGYSAGLFLQCLAIVVVSLMGSAKFSLVFSLRVVIFLIGVWWFVFTIPAAFWLRPRPGPPLPSKDPDNPSGNRTWYQYIIYSWASLWRTIKLARRLKDIVLFLAAWFLLSDAIATVSVFRQFSRIEFALIRAIRVKKILVRLVEPEFRNSGGHSVGWHRPLACAERRPAARNGEAPELFRTAVFIAMSCPFRPPSGRTEQAGRLFHPFQLRNSG